MSLTCPATELTKKLESFDHSFQITGSSSFSFLCNPFWNEKALTRGRTDHFMMLLATMNFRLALIYLQFSITCFFSHVGKDVPKGV